MVGYNHGKIGKLCFNHFANVGLASSLEHVMQKRILISTMSLTAVPRYIVVCTGTSPFTACRAPTVL